MDFEKIIEELKTEITILKKKVQSLETFILNIPNPKKYINGDFSDYLLHETDDLYPEAEAIVRQHDRASASLLQRRLAIGYSRAARIIDQLEEKGVLGPGSGSTPREVLKNTEKKNDDRKKEKRS